MSKSVGVSYPAINPTQILNLPVALPPPEAQVEIAPMLDVEISQIDELSYGVTAPNGSDSMLAQTLHLLKTRKQALITAAVCGGLS